MRHERIRSFMPCGAEAERAMTRGIIVGGGVRPQAAATEVEIPATLPDGSGTMATDFSRGELGKKMGVMKKPVYAFKLLRTVRGALA